MKILIVDDESDITEIVEFLTLEKFPPGTETLIASSGNKAIGLINENHDIDLCICDHNMADGMGPDVLKYIIKVKSKTKFILNSTVLPADQPLDYPANFVFLNIQKPDISGGIDRLFELAQKTFFMKSAGNTEEYVPVTVHVLSLMGKAPGDVYIKMSDNKFLKCVNKNEDFTSTDKQNYKQKLVEELYFKKGDQALSIKQVILKAVQEVMNRSNLPLIDKMSITHSQLIGLIKFAGMTTALAEVSQKNIQLSVKYMMKSPVVAGFWQKLNLLGEYPSQLYALHSMLSSLVLSKLLWNSEATVYKLTLCAFLQDISLDSIPLMELNDYRDFLENESRFTSSEIKTFQEHPRTSSEIATSFKDIPPDVDHILLEQHEMPDGNGIPHQLSAEQIGSLSCIFILTGIFARHVLRKGEAFSLDEFILYLENRGYSKGNFKEGFKIIKSLEKIHSV